MKNVTYAIYLADSAVRAAVEREARRARVHAMHRYLLMPLARFCGRLTAVRGIRLQLDPRAALAR